VRYEPADRRPFFNLVHQHLDSFHFRAVEIRRNHEDGGAEVERGGAAKQRRRAEYAGRERGSKHQSHHRKIGLIIRD
jgi:hypothetical protein